MNTVFIYIGDNCEKNEDKRMIEVGKLQTLIVTKETEQGFYLNEQKPSEREVLLPKSQVPDNLQIGDEIEAFVYRDSRDRKIATTNQPKLMLGELAPLKVVSINRIGAFLDWGLERDLFLPFKQQIGRIHKGETHLVGMYVDKSDRLCATMKVYELLQSNAPYQVNDRVVGTIYSFKEAYGAFVAVDNKYHGLIPIKELFGDYKIGQTMELRVRNVRPDGKLELSMRKTTHLQMEDDARKIMDALEENDGELDIHDKSSPDVISAMLGMSKAAFKRAAGRLMKEGAIEMTSNGIKRNW